MSQDEIIRRLREPFACFEVEWKLQVTSSDKVRGMAVAYIDSRAIQKRLDEVVGPFHWRNEYRVWQDKAQLCGLSIYHEERGEWITKWDGAENTDIEPIKGGLTDSFKRAASVWGVGRYLYQIDGVWVDVEPKGKSFAIKQNQYGKLESGYNQAVSNIFGSAAHQNDSHTGASGNQASAPSTPQSVNHVQPSTPSAYDYQVHSVKPSGKSSQLLELVDSNGEVISAYVKTSDQAITTGACLRKVQMERKQSSYGEYNLISAYQLAA